MKPIFHLHVPKTGGQTLGMRLSQAMSADKVYYMLGEIEHSDDLLLDEIIKTKLLVSSHVKGAVFSKTNVFDIVCLVRNPIDHIISNYFHIKRDKNNILNGIICANKFEKVFDQFPSVFFNFQVRYIVGSFYQMAIEDLVVDEARFLSRHLFAALDRIKWLGVTEELEEFVRYFSLSSGLAVRNTSPSKNIASIISKNQKDDMRGWLTESTHLFALDSLIYSEALNRFSKLREEVVSRAFKALHVGSKTSINYQIAFAEPQKSIVLTDGWYPLNEVPGWGIEFRAGPKTLSLIKYHRTSNDDFLQFDIAFVAGVLVSEFLIFNVNTKCILPISIEDKVSYLTVSIDLSDQGPEGDIAIYVPRAYPLSIFDQNYEENNEICPYSTGRWRYVKK